MMCELLWVLALLAGTVVGIADPGPPEPTSHDTTIEASPALSHLSLGSLYGKSFCGHGARLSYPWREHALLEGEYSRFVNLYGKHSHSLFLTGLRVGTRGRRLGAFIKLQPGMFRVIETSYPHPPPFTRFALAVGGVAEAHLDRRVYIRADNDYLVIWFEDATFWPGRRVRPGISGHYRMSIGMGVRFQ